MVDISLSTVTSDEVEEWFDSLDEDEKAEVVEYAESIKPFVDMVIAKHKEEIK